MWHMMSAFWNWLKFALWLIHGQNVCFLWIVTYSYIQAHVCVYVINIIFYWILWYLFFKKINLLFSESCHSPCINNEFVKFILWFYYFFLLFSSVQSLSCVWLFVTTWTAAHQTSLSITNSWSPPKPMSIELVMPSNHLILCRPLLLLSLIIPRIKVFSNDSALCIRWPKYWSFSFNISPTKEHPGLISFRMDWLDLLAVQGTLESSPTPQFKSINSAALSFLHSPTLTSIHDYWKTHSFNQMDLCPQSNVSAF